MGIGLASLAVPIYIVEVSEVDVRGKLVTVDGLCICKGQFVVGMVDGAMSGVQGGWRFMLGFMHLPNEL